MTNDRDIERIVGHWLDDGPTEVPDRVIDVMTDRIGRERQRPAWRLRWRDPSMPPRFVVAAGLAAAIVVAVGGLAVLRPSSNDGTGGVVGGGGPIATPSSMSSPSVDPSPSPIVSTMFRPAVRVTTPAGWTVDDGDRSFLLNAPVAGAAARRSIGLMSGPFVTLKDPSCNDQAPAAVGTTAAQVLASLTRDPRLVVAAPQQVAMGDHVGQMVDIRVAPTWTGTCDWSAGKGAVLIVSATTTGPAFGTGGTGRDRYIFVDVDGSVVAIDLGTSEGSDFDSFMTEAMPIVATISFP